MPLKLPANCAGPTNDDRPAVLQLPAKTAGRANPSDAEEPSPALALPALVFCRSRKRVEGVARELAATLGWDRVGAYHAGLTKEERTAIESWFFSTTDAVLVATCAYGMGVDKSNIRTVIHYDLPGSVEAFLQESGRAGRDGSPAESIVLFSHDDVVRAATISDHVRRGRYECLLDYCRTAGCRREYLMELLGAGMEVCFGCDNCRGREAGHPAQGSAEDADEAAKPGVPSGPGEHTDPPNPTSAVLEQAGRAISDATAYLLALVGRNQRLLTAAQVARLLTGSIESNDRWAARRLPSPRARAAFRSWSIAQISQLVEGLLASDELSRQRRGPWRNCLALTRNALRNRRVSARRDRRCGRIARRKSAGHEFPARTRFHPAD